MQKKSLLRETKFCIALFVVGIIGGSFLISSLIDTPLFCTESISDEFIPTTTTPMQLDAILHYATSQTVPQQSIPEITLSFNLLRSISPCNFLVFGLGHDSLMWASLNPNGKTLFLEEDPMWVRSILKNPPLLNTAIINYRTKLADADELLNTYQSEPECSPSRGYFKEAPGRMGAIYSAAVMARNRKKPGVTHVLLHDVDRKVEKAYAEEFLCRKNLKKAVGRLWHFEIPPVGNVTVTNNASSFC